MDEVSKIEYNKEVNIKIKFKLILCFKVCEEYVRI